jgi:hypothetical protein
MSITASSRINPAPPLRQTSYLHYLPLIAGLSVVAVVSWLLRAGQPAGVSTVTWLMNTFMGGLCLVYALPKLFDMSRVVPSGRQYNVLGLRSRLSAKAYPYIEVGLGLSFLSKLGTGSAISTIILNSVVLIISGTALLSTARSHGARRHLFSTSPDTSRKFSLS